MVKYAAIGHYLWIPAVLLIETELTHIAAVSVGDEDDPKKRKSHGSDNGSNASLAMKPEMVFRAAGGSYCEPEAAVSIKQPLPPPSPEKPALPPLPDRDMGMGGPPESAMAAVGNNRSVAIRASHCRAAASRVFSLVRDVTYGAQ